MNIERTEHDFCFEDKVKEVGYWYYVNNLLANISINKNTYSCTIEKYNAMIEFEDKTKETINDLTCTCSFYEHEDCNCPHIYALICYAFNVIKEDSRYNIKLLEKYKNANINKIKSEFNKGNIDIIDLDILGYKYEELFPDTNDDPLIEALDTYIESLPLELLEKVREQNEKDNFDNDIIDKAISNKKAKIKAQEKSNKRGLLSTLFTLFSSNNNTNKFNSIEDEEINNGNYEPYQYEEEELEEDDYHYDDLD